MRLATPPTPVASTPCPPHPQPPTPFLPAVTTQNFDQQEALLARDLAALISDGQYLKHYGGPPLLRALP